MYRVAVVGSKPAFTKAPGIQFDAGYFANGAAARAHFFDCRSKVGVLSYYIVQEPRSPLVAACYNEVQRSSLSSFIILGGDNSSAAHMGKMVSPRTITYLTLRTLGVRTFFSLLRRGNALGSLRELAKLALKGSCTSTKPSTGLAAVLLAVERVPAAFKTNFEVNVFGIGLSNDGYDYLTGTHERGHLTADEQLILALRRERIKFYDV